MCDFRVLTQNNDGYVVYCPDCKAIQMAYGTALVRLRIEHFNEIKQLISTECTYRCDCSATNMKNIFIPIDEGFMLCLTYKELCKLEELVIGAAAIYDTYQILDDVNLS